MTPTLLSPPQVDWPTSRDHQGAEALPPPADACGSSCPRAFSLIEVLLAIFILGVGVISIAALFPAGIAQQRASVDDVLGQTIANNALAIIRTKLKPEDFGNFEQFTPASSNALLPPRATIPGDFNWLRPAFIFVDDPATPNVDERGAINVFSAGGFNATEFPGGYNDGAVASTPSLFGIPYNRALYGSAPRVIFTQNERYYPTFTQNGTGEKGKPQYVWDCMFRKFQGKVLVAIFVYRVTRPGAGSEPYIVPPDAGNAQLPPLPIWLDLTALPSPQYDTANGAGPWDAFGPDQTMGTADDRLVVGTADGQPYNPDDQAQQWQEPRQWILDGNNNVHRVLSRARLDESTNSGRVEVELVRQIPAMPALGVYYVAPGGTQVNDVVRDIWYLPTTVKADPTPGSPNSGDEFLLTLTPIYATVKEL